MVLKESQTHDIPTCCQASLGRETSIFGQDSQDQWCFHNSKCQRTERELRDKDISKPCLESSTKGELAEPSQWQKRNFHHPLVGVANFIHIHEPTHYPPYLVKS